MAAVTVSSIRRESAGSNTLIRAKLASVDSGDTWASGIKEIVAYWATGTDNPIQHDEGIDVSLSGSTFTFSSSSGSRTAELCVLAKI